MDDSSGFTAARIMMASLAYAAIFLLALIFQLGFVASLPPPWGYFPLMLVIGIIVLQERSVMFGVLWLVTAGLIQEFLGLGPGVFFASLVAAGVATALALLFFAKRSFWALLGVGAGTALAYLSARLIWLIGLQAFISTEVYFTGMLAQGWHTFWLAMLGIFVFGAYLRRLIRWSRHKFVRKDQVYDG